jgi:alpha-D-ribose 1-methylphosphonate 5-triphosphate diphosphatase PhnM
MPAISKAQRQFLAIQEHLPVSQRKVHMSKEKFREFTKTKEAGLPEHVKPKREMSFRRK